MVILSGSVQFALTVPAVVYFHRVPLTSLLANLLAVPLLNGAVGFGLTGLIAGSTMLTSIAGMLVRMAGDHGIRVRASGAELSLRDTGRFPRYRLRRRSPRDGGCIAENVRIFPSFLSVIRLPGVD